MVKKVKKIQKTCPVCKHRVSLEKPPRGHEYQVVDGKWQLVRKGYQWVYDGGWYQEKQRKG